MWYKYSYLALLSAGLVLLAGCQKKEDGTLDGPQQYTLTVEAVKSAGTKALSLTNMGSANEGVSAQWANGEQVSLYRGGNLLGVLEATVTGEGKAILRGSLPMNLNLSENETLTLIYPAISWDYDGQNGLLEGTGSISAKYDFAKASVTVSGIDSENRKVSTSTGVFYPQQSVYRLGFSAGDEELTVKHLWIASKGNKLVKDFQYTSNKWTPEYATASLQVTPGSATSDLLYVALRNEYDDDDVLYFTVSDAQNNFYLGSRIIQQENLGNGRFLKAGSRVVVNAANVSIDSTTPVSAKEKIW